MLFSENAPCGQKIREIISKNVSVLENVFVQEMVAVTGNL